MASNRALALGFGIGTALGLVSFGARAEPSPSASERETARSLMTEGRDRRARNDLKGALGAFKAADAIMHVPTTALEVIRTEVALGQLVEARGDIRDLLRVPTRADEPKPFVAARAAALAMDGDLAARIPSIRVTLENAPPEPHIKVDGAAIPADALTAPMKVDPGHHVVEGGDGAGAARAEVTLAEGENKSVTLTLPPMPADASQAAASSAAPDDSKPEAHVARTIAIVGFSVGGLGLAVGSISGLFSMQKTSALKGTCNGDQCPASSASDFHAARTMATVSTVGFVVAGAGVGVGIGALLFGGKGPEATARAEVTPWVGLGSAGLRGTF
jgi:hypothetical protein